MIFLTVSLSMNVFSLYDGLCLYPALKKFHMDFSITHLKKAPSPDSRGKKNCMAKVFEYALCFSRFNHSRCSMIALGR